MWLNRRQSSHKSPLIKRTFWVDSKKKNLAINALKCDHFVNHYWVLLFAFEYSSRWLKSGVDWMLHKCAAYHPNLSATLKPPWKIKQLSTQVRCLPLLRHLHLCYLCEFTPINTNCFCSLRRLPVNLTCTVNCPYKLWSLYLISHLPSFSFLPFTSMSFTFYLSASKPTQKKMM